MEVQQYLEKMKAIQNCLLELVDDESHIEESYQNLIKIIEDQKIRENQHDFKSFLHLILNISNNHHRPTSYFNKIDRILNDFKEEIKKYFLNYEIFNIFKSNKRILLFLIEEKLLVFDQSIANVMISDRYFKSFYPNYFFPEIKPFIDEKTIEKIAIEQSEKRKIGENDNFLCEVIRKDLIEEFTVYLKKSNMSVDTKIEPSIFETNSFLIKNLPTLIECAAFYGSIQIFNYLLKNKAQLNQSLWLYAIHGQNMEIIRLVQDNHVQPEDGTYEGCLEESIKCHHNEMANYFLNLLKNKDFNLFSKSLKYYNFAFIQNESINKSAFYELCKFDYTALVNSFIKNSDIDINAKKISIITVFLMGFQLCFFE